MSTQGGDDGCGCGGQLLVGDAQNGEATAAEITVARSVSPESRAVRVVPVAVGLDDQALNTPEEVDGVGAEADIDLGLGNLMVRAKAQEGSLEAASCGLRPKAKVTEGPGTRCHRDAPPARAVRGS